MELSEPLKRIFIEELDESCILTLVFILLDIVSFFPTEHCRYSDRTLILFYCVLIKLWGLGNFLIPVESCANSKYRSVASSFVKCCNMFLFFLLNFLFI